MITTMTATELGCSVPSVPHAISVSLPTWRDNVDYEEGAKRVVDSMKTGYPRFFIHRSIQLLARVCETKFGTPSECCLLFPSATIANDCRSYLRQHSPSQIAVRLVQYSIRPQSPSQVPSTEDVELHVVFFPIDSFPLAKSYWQHKGDGISSRMAEKCLQLLGIAPPTNDGIGQTSNKDSHSYSSAKSSRYARATPFKAAKHGGRVLGAVSATVSPAGGEATPDDNLTTDYTAYVEERYGRNLPLSAYSVAKRALRRRVAGVLLRDSIRPSDPVELLGAPDADFVGQSWRGVREVAEDDVFLYPTGMSAIWHAHDLALGSARKTGRGAGKSVCFGFPYTDTLKILQKWGPGSHFLGHGLDKDIPALRELAEAAQPPLTAVFCEFPSNPLLRSPNLRELRKVADEFGFLIIVDETIGNFVNVDVLQYADIVVSSLTKVFSGETNVMGGSLVLNPHGKQYEILKTYLHATYEDTYWPEDAVYMERNSRDFQRRIDVINHNAETIADFLRSQSVVYSKSTSNKVIKEVFYPKWVTRENFESCRNPLPIGEGERGPLYPSGFGGLLSMTFTSALAARVFFDSLACEKGPSLGTNFTLACPYTVLAHYFELDWAAEWGVEAELVRVSVGMEDETLLLKWFEHAIQSAEEAVRPQPA